MSWTIRKIEDNSPQDNSKEIKRLNDALRKAHKSGALLFCAAPDEGLLTGTTFKSYYPVGSEEVSNYIFKIGAATASNTTWEQTGKDEHLDFILPGHEVKEKDDDLIDLKKDSPKTGSSVATALAAGLAALIIHCVRLGAIETEHFKKHGAWDKQIVPELPAQTITLEALKNIKTARAMKQAFHKIPRSQEGDRQKYVEVDNTFEMPGKALTNKNTSKDDKWRQVSMLARDIPPPLTYYPRS